MQNDIDRLKRIIAKTLRRAKQWYFGYVICQVLVLALTIVAVLANFDPRVSAVLAFVAILGTECIRWRSDFWKSQGEFAKRRWEVADGLGKAVDNVTVADWLAAKPHAFLDDVNDRELAGSTFGSNLPPGPDRVIENTEESAWWSKHESRLMIWYLSAALVVLLIGVFVALSISIGGLSDTNAATTRAIAQNVGAVICAVLTFVFSINVVRLLASFVAFFVSAKTIVERCRELLRRGRVDERTSLLLLFDYQTARDAAPLLPTFIWKIHGDHLRNEWHHYRSKR
jgi:ABC-type multidrug transport system fused ATPase/permease subunit